MRQARQTFILLFVMLSVVFCQNAISEDDERAANDSPPLGATDIGVNKDADDDAGETLSKDLDDGTAVPYGKDEFPSWARDVRRAEIITLGSLPFTVLAATLCYSLVRYTAYGFDFSYVPNPFAKSGVGSLDQSEQIGVAAAAGGLSICIGLTDLFIHIARRKKQRRLIEEPSVIITPMEEAKGDDNGNGEGGVESGKGDAPNGAGGKR